MRGDGLWERPVNYDAIGATQAVDLLEYPPAGYRPFELRTRIGHGEARWEHAWQSALSWGIQQGSGFEVTLVDAPPHVTEGTYQPVTFDADGAPVAGAMRTRDGEAVYGPDGRPFIAAGDTVELSIPLGPFSVKAPCRVIYVIDERDRKGFAYGTLPGHPERGEELFVVERTDDGSVWMTIRAFSRPSRWYWWLAYPFLRFTQAHFTRRYFRSLSGPLGAPDER